MKSGLKIAFYVSGRATRLKNIINRGEESVNSNIGLVITDKQNEELEELLKSRKIEFIFISEALLEKMQCTFSDLILEEIKKREIQYLFVFGKKLLKGEILKAYEHKIINFHPSILPSFPGVGAIDNAIKAKAIILGNTAHFIDNSIDNGPIILQSIIPAEVYYKEGYEGVLKYQENMFFKIYFLLSNNRIHVTENGTVRIDGSKLQNEVMYPLID